MDALPDELHVKIMALVEPREWYFHPHGHVPPTNMSQSWSFPRCPRGSWNVPAAAQAADASSCEQPLAQDCQGKSQSVHDVSLMVRGQTSPEFIEKWLQPRIQHVQHVNVQAARPLVELPPAFYMPLRTFRALMVTGTYC